MYPLFRLLGGVISATRNTPLTLADVSEISFRCRPWDLDMFMEMNNGRHLTLYDLGRCDLALRSGLSGVLKQKKWGLVVAGSSVRYRKRIRFWDNVVMRTQVAGFDARWIYINQSMWVNGEPCSSVLLRIGVTSNGKVIEPQRVKDAMNQPDLSFPDDAYIEHWKDSESIRPWPPNP